MDKSNYLVILVGVCGTGKSLVGKRVADRLEVPFIDADKLKTTEDLPEGQLPQDVNLNEWLNALEELIVEQAHLKGCVLSCSVLKREDRRRLAASIKHPLDWVFMNSPYEDVVQRVEQGEHNRPSSLLDSDFETLEAPKAALTIDMTYSEEEMVDTILEYMSRKYW